MAKQSIYRSPSGRICHVEQHNSHDWRGWFEDNHSVEYSATTKREVLQDLADDALPTQ